MTINYTPATNLITLASGEVTIPALSTRLRNAQVLHNQGDGIWLLTANLRIEAQASLHVRGPEVRWLRLQSHGPQFVAIKAYGGSLTFSNTRVTSWDTTAQAVATDYEHGRSFILARNGARFTAQASEFSHLGYFANESYGVALRLSGTTGTITDSRFLHNFYGIYSYEASDLVIQGNEVAYSVRYGIDPHTRSNRLLIERNAAHHNGKQGIILAEACDNSVIRENTAYENQLHGIVIYQRSNTNIIEQNTAYSNGLQGININDSSHNIVRNNTVHGNMKDGIGIGKDAAENTIVNNHVYGNAQDGITLYSNANHNSVRANIVHTNGRHGIYDKGVDNLIIDNSEREDQRGAE